MIFLTLDQTLQIHRSMVETYGGSDGVRDMGLLHSAISMPQATFSGSYLHRDLFEMAAAYLYHIARNHPFLDGNKRVGAASAIIFLDVNDIEVQADEMDLVDIVLQAATGSIGKQDIASFLRDSHHPSLASSLD